MPQVRIDEVVLQADDKIDIHLPDGTSLYVYGNGSVVAEKSDGRFGYDVVEIDLVRKLKKVHKDNQRGK